MMVWVWGLAALLAACVLWWPVRVRIGFSCSKDRATLRLSLGRYVLYRLESGTSPSRNLAVQASPGKGPVPSKTGDGVPPRPREFQPEPVKKEVENATRPEFSPMDPEAEKDKALPQGEPGSSSERRLLQVLLTPGSEALLWKASLSVGKRFLRIFRLRLLDLQVQGLLEDPYWNGVWLGLSAGHFLPDWEGDKGLRAKGELSISVTGGRVLFFALTVLAQALIIAYRATRLYRATRHDQKAQALPEMRRWILDKLSPLNEAELNKG